MKGITTLATLAALMIAAAPAFAETKTATFDSAESLEAWTTEGDVTVDTSRNREGDGGGAMKVAPGAKAVWMLRQADGAGKVTLWFYEDGTQRDKPKERGSGPLVGIITTEGRVLTVGPVYAPYLTGNDTLCSAEFIPPTEKPWYGLTYLGLKRTRGWHRLTFDFDPDEGLTLMFDDTEPGRFNWATSKVKGFAGVVVLGDADQDNPQTAWVDDVTVELGGAMNIDPFEALVPLTDPPAEGPSPEIVPELAGKHPRLLFSQDDVADLKAFTRTEMGRIFMETLERYLPPSVPPKEPKFLTDATDGQRQGLWRLPTVALHYVLTGDQQSFDRAVGFLKLFADLPHWETHELDSGMSSANIMAGAALAFDWLYNDLEPEFREQFRKKLWQHARRQYYIGHLKRGKNVHYWQNDPQNNHRWHRNAGMFLAALTSYTGDPSQKWFMQKLAEEMKYVVDWLPEDGTSHESPGYMIFGAAHLTLGVQATDRCFGTNYLERPFFKNLPRFMIQTMTPDMQHRFHYGDQGGTEVGDYRYDVFELKCIGVHQQRDLLALADQRLKTQGVGTNIAWLGLLWYPRELKAASASDAATKAFFPDLGLAFMRDKWADDGCGAMFKCGPFGGYLLNRFQAMSGAYLNVAHDDPDANSFLLYADGAFLAESDRYSYQKKSANLNTLLVNGTGQTVPGRAENVQWWQPSTDGTMEKVAVITALEQSDAAYAIEGEAAGSYPANPPKAAERPALDRYRRTFLWVEGKYVLVLDDIRAPEMVDLTWLVQSPQIDNTGAPDMRFVLTSGEAECPMMVAATDIPVPEVVDSPADNRKAPLGWKQLRLSFRTDTVRVATVYDLWGGRKLVVNLEPTGPDHAMVTVAGEGFMDTWDWTAGTGQFGPSTLVGKTAEGRQIIAISKPEPETQALIDEVAEAKADKK